MGDSEPRGASAAKKESCPAAEGIQPRGLALRDQVRRVPGNRLYSGRHLYGRKGIDYSRFKSLASAIPAEFEATDAILDGEIVVLDERGHPQFYELISSRGKPVFASFDLLWLDGEDLRDLPLWQRKSLLEGCLRRPHEGVLYVDHVEQRGEALFSPGVRH